MKFSLGTAENASNADDFCKNYRGYQFFCFKENWVHMIGNIVWYELYDQIHDRQCPIYELIHNRIKVAWMVFYMRVSIKSNF